MAYQISEKEVQTSRNTPTPNSIAFGYIVQREACFRHLVELRRKGWENPKGDEHFEKQRKRADNAGEQGALQFYRMMQQIGDEIQSTTAALRQNIKTLKVLDLCMAPGGYSASALKYNPSAAAYGITLPPDEGGHELLLPRHQSQVLFLDITMLAAEFGVETPPSTHPDYTKFLNTRPYVKHQFQLVFCDGQVLRTHRRGEYREPREALRLTVSQLILSMQRISPGGTLIMLLHKLEAWDTIELLHIFSGFSTIELFKPQRKHATRSSFYLIARNVQPDTKPAKLAVNTWKQAWQQATFGGDGGTGGPRLPIDDNHIHMVLDQFGDRLVELGRPIWEIQARALSGMKFMT